MKRNGIILLAILVIIALAAMIVASLLFSVRARMSASLAQTKGEQAHYAAMSGIERAIEIIRKSPQDAEGWYDNDEQLANQLVYDDGGAKWYFTVWAADPDDPKSYRSGATDEASRININTADEETLLRLPNMTKDLVDCLLDYRDADSDPRPSGAEQEYYDQLKRAYTIKNGPLTTLEELLLVKGFDGRILYGNDANLNGMLDPNENDGDASFPPDNGDGKLDCGLRGLATTWSYENDTSADGKPRIGINGDVEKLPALLRQAGLPQPTIDFILLYRTEGSQFKQPSDLLEMKYEKKNAPPSNAEIAKSPISASLLRLPQGSQISSGVTGDVLAVVMDKLTVRTNPTAPVAGLVNVNTAPAAVLAALPGMNDDLAQQIVDVRSGLEPAIKSNLAWLYSQNLMDAATFQKVAPLLTTRSLQFHIQCVGFSVPAGRFKVLEAVVDLAPKVPQILYLRDLTRLGLPFAVDVNTLESASK